MKILKKILNKILKKKFSSTNNYIKIRRTTILIIFVIVSFFLGRYSYYLESGLFSADLTMAPGKTYQQGYNHAMNTAQIKLESIGIMPKSINHISNATIKSISADGIVVEFDASSVDLLKDGMMTKTIVVPDGVFVEQHIQKSQEEMDKIFSEYQHKVEEMHKKISNGEDAISFEMPMSYTVKTLNVSDLKTGDRIAIESKTDVREQAVIEAVSIQLISQQ